MKIIEWKLSPDFIPHQDFHKGYWLNINEPNPWYYFFPTVRSYDIPKDYKFYDSLDRDLLNITKLLHNYKIPTTPSCSGHFSPPEYYVDIYSKLKQNEDKIRSNGVILNNKETSKNYYYKNPSYTLPWSQNEFVDRSLDYQTKGVLGIVDPSAKLFDYISNELDCMHDGGITIVFENSTNSIDKSQNWNQLYKSVNNYLLT